EMEIHVSGIKPDAQDAARVVSAAVQAGSAALGALRRINIVLKGNTRRDVEKGNEVLKEIKDIIRIPLTFNDTHSVLVRHRWAYYEYDHRALYDYEMDEGSGWTDWKA
ncbi:14512_t:CDS:1, partial [Acaulospora colombiana]